MLEQTWRGFSPRLVGPRVHALRFDQSHKRLRGRVVPRRGYRTHGRANLALVNGRPHQDLLIDEVVCLCARSESRKVQQVVACARTRRRVMHNDDIHQTPPSPRGAVDTISRCCSSETRSSPIFSSSESTSRRITATSCYRRWVRATKQLCFLTRFVSSSFFASITALLPEMERTTPTNVIVLPMSATTIDFMRNLPNKTRPLLPYIFSGGHK